MSLWSETQRRVSAQIFSLNESRRDFDTNTHSLYYDLCSTVDKRTFKEFSISTIWLTLPYPSTRTPAPGVMKFKFFYNQGCFMPRLVEIMDQWFWRRWKCEKFTDRQTDKWQTPGDQKCSHKPLAQVNLTRGQWATTLTTENSSNLYTHTIIS